jgi:hypothetical protein
MGPERRGRKRDKEKKISILLRYEKKIRLKVRSK